MCLFFKASAYSGVDDMRVRTTTKVEKEGEMQKTRRREATKRKTGRRKGQKED